MTKNNHETDSQLKCSATWNDWMQWLESGRYKS